MTVVFIWCRRRRAAHGATFGIYYLRGRTSGIYMDIYVCVGNILHLYAYA